uniref:Uncharacterized protein n=1 Tax=Oryza barthii TaxID=65489 RepID=A0A0D3HL64_9ORYZ
MVRIFGSPNSVAPLLRTLAHGSGKRVDVLQCKNCLRLGCQERCFDDFLLGLRLNCHRRHCRVVRQYLVMHLR